VHTVGEGETRPRSRSVKDDEILGEAIVEDGDLARLGREGDMDRDIAGELGANVAFREVCEVLCPNLPYRYFASGLPSTGVFLGLPAPFRAGYDLMPSGDCPNSKTGNIGAELSCLVGVAGK